MTNRVRVNSIYTYHANLFDILHGPDHLINGDTVRVINLHGCPKANTMGMCYVADVKTGEFIGMVCTNSLTLASKKVGK